MHTSFVHSDLSLPEIGALLPNARLFIPSASGYAAKQPFLVKIEAQDDFAITQGTLISLVENGHALTPLPHPRDTTAFSDAQIAKLQTYAPKIKKGDCMKDLLGYIYAVCPSTAWDPALHCF